MTRKLDRDGYPRTFIGCMSLGCRDLPPGDWLREVAEIVETTPAALLADPLRWLGPYLDAAGRTRESKPELPSEASFAGWHAALMVSGAPFDWLTEERGLSLDVIERLRIGWDADRGRLVFPMYRAEELVAAKWRRPRAGENMRWFSGCGKSSWPLYPEPERGEGWTLLLEGELDAACGLSARLPSVSVTGGAGNWRDEWADDLAGLRVAVCFDLGAERFARRAASRLQELGVTARRLDLRRFGLRRRGTDLSDFLDGGDPDAIRRAVA